MDKIESMDYGIVEGRGNIPTIEMQLSDTYATHVLKASYATRVWIQWLNNTREHETSVRVVAIEDIEHVDDADPITSIVKKYKDFRLIKAINWVIGELI